MRNPRWLPAALIFIGLLIILPSGLCTGFIAFMAISNNEWNGAVAPLIFGAPAIIGGAILLRYGLRHIEGYHRKSNAPDQS